MNTRIVAGLAVAVTFLTGLLVISVAQKMNTETSVGTTTPHVSNPTVNYVAGGTNSTNTNSTVNTSVNVVPEKGVTVTVTVTQ